MFVSPDYLLERQQQEVAGGAVAVQDIQPAALLGGLDAAFLVFTCFLLCCCMFVIIYYVS